MTRTAADALRRGFDNVAANWQLLLIRLAEGFLFTAIAIGAAVVIVLAVGAAVGLSALPDYQSSEGLETILELVLQKWLILLLAVIAFLLLLTVLLVVHCFIEAGIVRVYVDAERAAGPAVIGSRWRYRLFSAERWGEGAKEGWLVLFWIYNVVWGIWGLLLLIPLIPIAAGALLMIRDEEMGAAAGIGCVGLALLVIFMIPITIAATLWSRKAIVIAIARRVGARESLRLASSEIRNDFARHLLVALAVLAVSLALGGFLAGFGFVAAFAKSTTFMIMMLPIRILTSVLNSLLSGAMDGWLTSSYAALTPESKP